MWRLAKPGRFEGDVLHHSTSLNPISIRSVSGAAKSRGPRLATFLIYLSDVPGLVDGPHLAGLFGF